MRGVRLALLVWVAVFGASRTVAQSPPETGTAEDAEGEGRDSEARALFEAGEVAFHEGRYESALEYLERSYELSRRPTLLYNIATTYDRLRRDAEALATFERYLAASPDARNRAEVERRVHVLREAVARGVASPTTDTSSGGPPAEVPMASGGGDAVAGGVTAGVGGAVALAGAVLMGLAAADVAAVEGAPFESAWGAVRDAYARSEAESIAGAVLLGVGAAAIAAGLVWALLPGERTVEVAPTSAGAVLRAVF